VVGAAGGVKRVHRCRPQLDGMGSCCPWSRPATGGSSGALGRIFSGLTRKLCRSLQHVMIGDADYVFIAPESVQSRGCAPVMDPLRRMVDAALWWHCFLTLCLTKNHLFAERDLSGVHHHAPVTCSFIGSGHQCLNRRNCKYRSMTILQNRSAFPPLCQHRPRGFWVVQTNWNAICLERVSAHFQNLAKKGRHKQHDLLFQQVLFYLRDVCRAAT